MASRPRVTVVIPTYNAAGYLGEAIRSALDQTFEDLELVVLDNASTDETPQVVAEFDDPRLRYHRNDKNIGFVGNANLGLTMARGELLAYLGADDIWDRRFLAEGTALLDAEPRLSFVHGAAIWIDEKGNPYGQTDDRWKRITPGATAFMETFRYGFCFSTMLMRTALARRAGPLDQAWQDIADSWLFLRLCLEGDVGYLRQPLVRYRVHQKSLSLALYSDGKLFGQHLKLARHAFDWPGSRAAGLNRQKRRGLRGVAAQSIRILPVMRLEGTRRSFLRILGGILSQVPELALHPGTWARVAFGLLPRRSISRLREWRRRRWARTQNAGDGTTGRKPGGVHG